jgi:cation diffusion facilitator CzcD-associated flavoprotein CzcO
MSTAGPAKRVRVAILGGGMGGLAAALAMVRREGHGERY